jgi:aryl-alcohol dehydrogenase
MEIQAALARAPHGAFSVETAYLDEPRPDEIQVRLVATGICHTDLAVLEEIMPLPMPIVLGHEGAGIVEKVGSAVTGLSLGDHVVLTFGSCGHCLSCETDHPAYCVNAGAINYSGRRADGSATLRDKDGAALNGAFFSQSSFATRALANARNAIRVRPDAPLRLLGPLGCGFMTGAGTVLNVLEPRANGTLAIFGAGALGFAALFAAKLAGCERIVAVDRVPSRLELALQLGATNIIDAAKENLGERLAALGGLDYAIDTTGVPKVVEAAIQGLKMGGTCILLGASAESQMAVNIMHMIPGRTIRGVIEGDSSPSSFIPFLVDRFMEGRFPIDRLVRFYPFDRINAAVADAISGKTIKPILEFS